MEFEEDLKLLTTINKNSGLYMYNILPYGVNYASSILQRVIEHGIPLSEYISMTLLLIVLR